MKSSELSEYLINSGVLKKLILREERIVYDYVAIFSDNYPEKFVPGGVDIYEEIALQKVLGECMEIYAATLFGPLPDVDLRGKMKADMTKFFQIENKRSAYQLFNESVNDAKWIKGKNLLNDKELYLPGFSVYLNYNRFHQRYYPNFSQGLGSGESEIAAIIHGIIENIETDASMIFWRCKLRLPLIKHNIFINQNIQILLALLKNCNVLVRLIYSTLDLPINIVIAYLRFNEYPFVTFGVGSGEDIDSAALKSIEEALLIRNTLIVIKKHVPIASCENASDIKTFLDHAIFVSKHPDAVNWVDDLVEDDIQPINQTLTINYLKKVLVENELQCFYVNLTHQIFREKNIFQTKVIIPQLCQKDMNHNNIFSNNERYTTVPKKLGLLDNHNLTPHPYG